MTSNYNIKVVKKQVLKKTGQNRTQFSITKKNEQMITLENIKVLYAQFTGKGISPERIGLVGLNGERYTTIKSPHTDELPDYADDEYLDGKSSEIKDKITKFYNLQLIIY